MSPLVARILASLESAENREPNPHLQTDIRIAWITVRRAAHGDPLPHVSASYAVLGLHPDRVWPAIIERRKSQLGKFYGEFFGEERPEIKTAPGCPPAPLMIVAEPSDGIRNAKIVPQFPRAA